MAAQPTAANCAICDSVSINRVSMFDHAAAFCEMLYGEKVSMEGVRSSTMTCLALETLPLPVYDIMAM